MDKDMVLNKQRNTSRIYVRVVIEKAIDGDYLLTAYNWDNEEIAKFKDRELNYAKSHIDLMVGKAIESMKTCWDLVYEDYTARDKKLKVYL